LIFVAGAFAAKGVISLVLLWIILCAAAILGDSLNYFIGNYFGRRAFRGNKFFNPENLRKTEKFYEKYGAKTIIIARFIPIIRTFAPFIAGIGKMQYSKFLFYNIIGGVLWVSLFLFSGYWFVGIPFVENNLTLVIFIIIFVSVIPAIVEYIGHKR